MKYSVFIFVLIMIGNAVMASLQIKPAVLMSSHDIRHIEVLHQGLDTLLSIELTKPAAQRLSDYSAHHLGEKLPVIIDHRLISSPVIRAPLESKFILGPVSQSLAQDLVKALP